MASDDYWTLHDMLSVSYKQKENKVTKNTEVKEESLRGTRGNFEFTPTPVVKTSEMTLFRGHGLLF